jgi:hypothetical protein
VQQHSDLEVCLQQSAASDYRGTVGAAGSHRYENFPFHRVTGLGWNGRSLRDRQVAGEFDQAVRKLKHGSD